MFVLQFLLPSIFSIFFPISQRLSHYEYYFINVLPLVDSTYLTNWLPHGTGFFFRSELWSPEDYQHRPFTEPCLWLLVWATWIHLTHSIPFRYYTLNIYPRVWVRVDISVITACRFDFCDKNARVGHLSVKIKIPCPALTNYFQQTL
jgi:hypothetical protein